ncbi:MAG: hypothetical protein RLY86_208 [Pseudomonadota bacterium]|jgi:hypothetical protein
MRIGQLFSNRFLLLLGGGGVVFGSVGTGRLGAMRAVSADDAAGLAEIVAEMGRHGTRPVTMLLDLADMNFRREQVPVVGLFDRAKVLKRRLNLTFPEVEVRGTLAMGAARSGGGRRELPYLFAAVANSTDWARWREWLKTLPNPVNGIGLLPVEVADMAWTLAQGLLPPPPAEAKAPAAEEGETWTLLLLRHWTGGIRQIVLRDREMVLTRITPSTGEVEGELGAEVRSTLGYLARLGFSGRAGIRVVAIGPATWQEELEGSALPISTAVVADTSTALDMLSLGRPLVEGTGPLAAADTADSLSLAWAARRAVPRMDVLPESWRLRHRVDGLARAGTWVVAGLSLAVAGQIASDGAGLLDLRQQTQAVNEEMARLGADRDATLSTLLGNPIPPRFAEAAVGFAAAWRSQPSSPAPLLETLVTLLPPEIQVESVTWTAPDQPTAAGRSGNTGPVWELAPPPPPRLEIELVIPDRTGEAAAVRMVAEIAERLDAAMPDHIVRVDRPPVTLDLTAALTLGAKPREDNRDGYRSILVVEAGP